MTEYRLVRSRRKTLSVEVKNGEVVVRAPLRVPDSEIRRFVSDHEKWINDKTAKMNAARIKAESSPLTAEEILKLAEDARGYIPERVKYYAGLMGVTYSTITIRCQKTRWGSCSSKKNLNFNCLLMLAPKDVIDSVVVHELCHLKEMNHSKAFYNLLYGVFPDYAGCDRWLKTEGKVLLMRANKLK